MDVFALKKTISYLVSPVPLGALIMTLALVCVWLQKTSAWVRYSVSAAWFFLVFLPASPLSSSWLESYERLYPAYEPLEYRPIEQIIVLACYVSDDPELPITAQQHSCSRGRLVEALRIWHLHPQAEILLSGGSMRFGHSSQAQKGADFLSALGVPEEKLKVIQEGRDTGTEILAIKEELTDSTPVLVTSATHMKRAVRLFARKQVAVIPAPSEHLIFHNTGVVKKGWHSLVLKASDYYKTERAWYAIMANWFVTLQDIWRGDEEVHPKELELKASPEPLSDQTSSMSEKPASERNSLAQFQQLLEKRAYQQVLEQYEQQLKMGTERPYANALFKYVTALLEQKKSAHAFTLIKQLLEVDHSNISFIYLAMVASYHQQAYAQGIDYLIYMRDAHTPEHLADSVARYQKDMVKKHSAELIASANMDAMSKFLSQLIYLSEFEAADSLQKAIQQVERKEYLASLYPMQIQMRPWGKHHLIEVIINDSLTLELLLDTGASRVSIARSQLEQTHYEVVNQGIRSNTANGVAISDNLKIESLQVGEIRLTDFVVGTLENYSGQEDDGLLGQDFLNLFDWKVDQENHILYLNPK